MSVRAALALSLIALRPAPAQTPADAADSSLLTVERIYSGEFRGEPFGPARWLDSGAAYTTIEPAADGRGQEIVRYDTERGTRAVLVPAARLVPPGDTASVAVEDYAWSPDGARLLVYTNSRQVWRQNTRGDYWVLERATGRLRKLGGPRAKPSTLMFAKFSPDGGRVGYVRENNLYVEDLASGRITALTTDGSREVINGTFDWVYEEELDLRDGWRWSPDGRRIAYWQLVADRVRDFHLVNNTDSVYSRVVPVQYPKAGYENSAARVGVVDASGGATRWLAIAGDPRQHYLARMEWAASPDEVVVQRLNRLQNTNEVMLGDAATGRVRTVLVDRDSAWVDVGNDLVWLDGGRRFTWVSERDGWRHAYVVSRDGRSVRLVTPGAFDVVSVAGVDDRGGWLYYVASPGNPTQRYLFRTRLDGRGRAERLTPASQPGTHTYDLSPDFRWAVHAHSAFGSPQATGLVRLPGHAAVRPLAPNTGLRERVARLRRGEVEFSTLDLPGGVRAPAWLMKPPGFDPRRRYPLLFFVYGGPAKQTVTDAWGGADYLWHLLLSQRGYLVASVDNRGTPAPLGRAWRKVIYGRMGVVETEEQAAAARLLAARPYVDPARVGIWGWSNGGYVALNALFRHADVYRSGIAVAPVTSWAFYDNIYSERYNGLPSENREGYEAGAPLRYAGGLRGDLLLIHGSGDDNVHFQNTEVLIDSLIAANRPFELMEYPNRTHALVGGNTRRHLYEHMTRWLDEHLAGAAPAPRPERADGSRNGLEAGARAGAHPGAAGARR